MTALGLRLKELRIQRGLSLRGAAQVTGVDSKTISQVERGERHPFPRTLGRLAEGYKADLHELLELEGSATELEEETADDPLAVAPGSAR
jgi:transcriptional regulator with XRE-family HTH domain